jgi:methyl-accepting chemotaxis protein
VARRQRVEVEIGATDKASREIKKVESGFDRLRKAGSALRTHWLAVTAAGAGLVFAFKSIISASARQEEAMKKLEVATLRYGDAGKKVAEEAAAQAAALQKITKFGDEAIITQQALLTQMGVTAEKLPDATQATVDLAEAMGISLESAARNVGKTMGGFAGELGELIPELKELTAEELKAGAGIDLLAAKFRGTAENTETFSKSVSQLGNAFGDLQEALGDSVTQSDKARTSLSGLTKLIEALIPLARRLGDAMTVVGEVLWNLALPLRAVAGATRFLTDAYLDLTGATKITEVRTEALESAAKRLGVTTGELNTHIERSRDRMEVLDDVAVKVGDTFDEDAQIFLSFTDGLVKMDTIATKASPTLRVLDSTADGLAERTERLTNSTRQLTVAEERMVATTNRVAQSYLSAAQAVVVYRNAQGGSPIGGAGVSSQSARRQAEVDAAVAAGYQPYMGGTRIRLPGGGSRLVGTRRF